MNEAEMSCQHLQSAPSAAKNNEIAALIENKIIAGMNNCLSVNEIAASIATMLATRAPNPSDCYND